MGSHYTIDFDSGMPERKPVVGLSWQPQLPIPSSLKATDGSHTKPQTEASSSTVRKSSSELVDGLFVPPNDPKKLNKLLRKQAKDTAGKNWYANEHIVLSSKFASMAVFFFFGFLSIHFCTA